MRTWFNLSKARIFQQRFRRTPQDLLGHLGIYWVPRADYDELDEWFGRALNHIRELESRLARSQGKK